ncbi:MAG: hypothetical protein KBD53_08580 [Candidatus Omnitrophica bacterium]|nr:hypothetical protein [Candidatus Omnitrophota bacterium]
MSELAFNRIILEKNNQILAVVSIISLGLNLFLTLILIFSINQKPLIVYDDSGQVTTLNQKNFKLDEGILEGFARMISKEYLSFTAVSLPTQIEGIKQYLAESPKNAILESYKKNQKKLQEENVFHQYSIYGINITKKNNPFLVEVTGIKTVYANGNSKNINASYILEIQKIKQSEENPYGLLVSKITQKDEKETEDVE